MPDIKTTKQVIPVIYAYTIPNYPPLEGWTKIGETERNAGKRMDEQTLTAGIEYKSEWNPPLNAVYEGTNEVFHDKDFHAYMQKQNIERKKGKNYKGKEVDLEWFKITPQDARNMLYDFRADRGIIKALGAIPYSLRDEQMEAVEQTKQYFISHDGKDPEFLWNAKPRFGKTLTAYDLCMALNAVNILIVTNRPAISNSWYDDYEKFFGPESGYYFVSETDSLKGKAGVITREKFLEIQKGDVECKGCIEFVSLQDLKGSVYFGGRHEKLKHLYKGDKHTEPGIAWDVLIIDEAHEGVDTYKTDVAFNGIQRKYTLHLSGTPFKALANEKFERDAIYNWTYVDEQNAKETWNDEDRSNPYIRMPKLNMLTYRMSDIVLEKLSKGADFDDDGDNEAYAFDLNEFFKTDTQGKFIHDTDVDNFLDAITTQKKFPFSPEYRDELKHTLWVLKYVASAKALYKKLKNHPVFKDYEIVLAAGDGKITDTDGEVSDEVIDSEAKKAFDKVKKAINEHERTITLSVGQLTTGVTIPEWTAVMMLSNVKSPALYMQAAFRAQNPCEFHNNGKVFIKENAYVFDFDPARTLDIFEQFANGLYTDTSSGKGDSDTRKQHVRKLLNFFPVYGEDKDGEMIELDAEKVLSIPRQIHAQEVVRKGFMCNWLFQNISRVFAASSVVVPIINKMALSKEPITVNRNISSELNLNGDGAVEIPTLTAVGIASQIFGEKIYSNIETELQSAVVEAQQARITNNKKDTTLEKLKESLHVNMTNKLTEKAKEKYGKGMSKSTQASVTREINNKADKEIEKHYGEYSTQKKIIENERKKAVEQAKSEGRYEQVAEINANAERRQSENNQQFEQNIMGAVHTIIKDAGTTVATAIETETKEREKKSIEDNIRGHLRGFARTIPSFLMAYGDENTTLANFDSLVSDEVFQEVTLDTNTGEYVTLDEFRFLRDGGDYIDEETGETKHYDGHLFDEVVFNDSVKEFLRKKEELSDYFNKEHKEDIFDYIPPQRSTLIFTPKAVVKQMLDILEKEDPGCFDDPCHTFIDVYMKSGQFISELVKKLYNNENMIKELPDPDERLHWIFENQVYGLAPTEIIYRVTMSLIFGFKGSESIDKSHFKRVDTLPFAQNGTIESELDKIFGGTNP